MAKGGDLNAVKEQLAEVVATLRKQKQRLEGHALSLAAPPRAEDAARAKAPAARAAPAGPGRDPEVAESARENGRLRERLVAVEREKSRVTDEYVAVQEQNSELVGLYAALARLSGTLNRREVVAAIEEIVINMVGSEELALFELTPDGRGLAPTHVFGVDRGRLAEVPLGSGPIGRAAAQGRVHVASEKRTAASWQDAHLTACVPLKLGERVTGALAIFGLLGHKPALTAFDREIFDLLERYAGPALHLAAVHEQLKAAG
jgi:hypothetical protein